jgi:outer membrane protein OmpA-like peptidoglycan-associated protein
MTTSLRRFGLTVGCALWTAVAAAQSAPAQNPTAQAYLTPFLETRPATTTFFGDTGLWFVPTGEVLPNGKWSVTVYRRGTNWVEGYTNVADFAGTFGVGIKDRAEIFGSFLVGTRIDRDVRPVFVPSHPEFGSFIDRYPRVNRYWTGDHIGDFYVGAKINLWSEARNNPAALAFRGLVKLPTADKDVGNGTGKADFSLDFIASKEAAKLVEVSGYAGFEGRGQPDGFDTPSSAFRWGAGVGFPSRNWLRITGELNGFMPSNDGATTTARLTGIDGSISPLFADTENITRATFGITAQTRKGIFFGAGVSWNVPSHARDVNFGEDREEVLSDYYDMQFRIGYHPGVKTFAPPPPPPPPLPPPPPPPPPHTLTVKAECNPCTVEVGKTSTVTATAQDSIGCTVTYRWSAPTGTLAQPAERSTIWTAPQQTGTVPVTVTVTCPTDNKTASDTVNIQVIAPPVKEYTFEDVYFDFDRYSLRPEATRILDEAVAALRESPTRRVEIEGHTCSIGTAEYNLALGDRRANAVKDYLVSRGISADRFRTVSYGEERPKYDNAREETRRLNRRAALVVNLR